MRPHYSHEFRKLLVHCEPFGGPALVFGDQVYPCDKNGWVDYPDYEPPEVGRYHVSTGSDTVNTVNYRAGFGSPLPVDKWKPITYPDRDDRYVLDDDGAIIDRSIGSPIMSSSHISHDQKEKVVECLNSSE